METIRSNTLRLIRSEINQSPLNANGLQSETDSSDENDVFTQTTSGIIRLEEMSSKSQQQTNMTLAMDRWFLGLLVELEIKVIN